MVKKQTDHIQVKFDLIRAMLPHVPFDGWSLEALEQGAIDIGFEPKENIDTRKDIFRDLFKNGSIDFIDTFSEMIDLEVKNTYEVTDPKPERVPEKVKIIILMRLSLCQKYKEALDHHYQLQHYLKIQKNQLIFFIELVTASGE
jgi:ubiquinone biosynthesis protein COQ9